VIWSAVLENRIHHGRERTPINQYYKKSRALNKDNLSHVQQRYSDPFLHPAVVPEKRQLFKMAGDMSSSLAARSADSNIVSIPVPDKHPHSSILSSTQPSTTSSDTSCDTLTIPLSTALSMLNGDSDVFGNHHGGGSEAVDKDSRHHRQPPRENGGYQLEPAEYRDQGADNDDVPVLNIREEYSDGDQVPNKRRRVDLPTSGSSSDEPPAWKGIEMIMQSYNKYQHGKGY
jgi:hypothetical protein